MTPTWTNGWGKELHNYIYDRKLGIPFKDDLVNGLTNDEVQVLNHSELPLIGTYIVTHCTDK